MSANNDRLDEENFTHMVYQWRDRQAGVSCIYDPDIDQYSYNAYCLETVLVKELFTCEYEFLVDALQVVNDEFGNWDLVSLEKTSGCGSCAAKR